MAHDHRIFQTSVFGGSRGCPTASLKTFELERGPVIRKYSVCTASLRDFIVA